MLVCELHSLFLFSLSELSVYLSCLVRIQKCACCCCMLRSSMWKRVKVEKTDEGGREEGRRGFCNVSLINERRHLQAGFIPPIPFKKTLSASHNLRLRSFFSPSYVFGLLSYLFYNVGPLFTGSSMSISFLLFRTIIFFQANLNTCTRQLLHTLAHTPTHT
jgi:hypothetical protein